MATKTVELETTEAFLLTVALREYLNGDNQRFSDHPTLRAHPTSRLVIEELIARIDPKQQNPEPK